MEERSRVGEMGAQDSAPWWTAPRWGKAPKGKALRSQREPSGGSKNLQVGKIEDMEMLEGNERLGGNEKIEGIEKLEDIEKPDTALVR